MSIEGAPSVYGVSAQFVDPNALLAAARAVSEAGFSRFEVFTPYPIKELDEVVPARDLLPLAVLLSGASGTITALALQYGVAAWDYPLNIGGRPLNSWPAFIPITFELTVLFAACMAFFGTLWACGFPRPYHPVFNIQDIARATDDGFFLCIETDGEQDEQKAIDLLSGLNSERVDKVQP